MVRIINRCLVLEWREIMYLQDNKLSELARKIQKESVIIDAHSDLLFDVVRKRQMGRRKIIETDYLPSFIDGGINIIVASLYIDDEFLPEMALRRALQQISALYEEIDESFGKFVLCKNFQDIEQALMKNQLGILISFEGVEPLYNDLSLLNIFYELGVRILGLVWSRRNFSADGCHFNQIKIGTRGGLTDFGIKLIEKGNQLGMLVDVSHLNDKGFWDVIKFSKSTIIASHSNCRALASTMRNLTDQQIKAIAEKNGVIGINASNLLVADKPSDATLEYMVKHVKHIIDLVGAEHVGLGLDLCDSLISYLSPFTLKTMPFTPFDVLQGHKDLNKFIEAMLNIGLQETQIRQILGQNFLRVLKSLSPDS